MTLDQGGSQRVPNCLLFSKGGQLQKFGSEASDSYAEKDEEEKKNFYYFEHVKKFFKNQVGGAMIGYSYIIKNKHNGHSLYIPDYS